MDVRLEDLLLPELEATFNKALWLGVALSICLCFLLLWRWNILKNKPSFVALKKLKALKLEVSRSMEDSHSVALKLASLLCLGFGVKRLDQYQPVSIAEWNIFYEKLNMACYSSCVNVDANKLLIEAESWLKAQNG